MHDCMGCFTFSQTTYGVIRLNYDNKYFEIKINEIDENLKESTIPVKDLLIKTDNKYGITLDHAIDDIKRERGYNDPLFGDNEVIDLLMRRYGLEKRDVIRVLNYKFDGKMLDEGCGRKKTSKRAK